MQVYFDYGGFWFFGLVIDCVKNKDLNCHDFIQGSYEVRTSVAHIMSKKLFEYLQKHTNKKPA
jgi:hypothetical protein